MKNDAIILGFLFLVFLAVMKLNRMREEREDYDDGFRPRSASPHAFTSSRGHLVDLLECTECDHPEDHPIHGGKKK